MGEDSLKRDSFINMSANEEVEEHVHHAHEPFDKLVAGSMALIAALLAIVSVLGQHFNTETVLNQQLASDEWAYFQGKDTRRYLAQATHDELLATKGGADSVAAYAADASKYKQQASDIQEKAKDFEKERIKAGGIANRFHFGEVFLEVAIVFSSLSILTKRKPLFMGGVFCALAGVVIAATAYWA